jgi:hypothetical protein
VVDRLTSQDFVPWEIERLWAYSRREPAIDETGDVHNLELHAFGTVNSQDGDGVLIEGTGVCGLVISLNQGVEMQDEGTDTVMRQHACTRSDYLEEPCDGPGRIGIRLRGEALQASTATDEVVKDLRRCPVVRQRNAGRHVCDEVRDTCSEVSRPTR